MRHRIALGELEAQLDVDSYDQLYRCVLAQIEAGSLKPLKASGTNGKKPALYREYWQIEPDAEPDYQAYVEELQYRMSTEISIDYYMRHMRQYDEDRKWVLMLNDYLLSRDWSDNPPISMNERSFEIWGREKFLRQEQGQKILKRCGIDAARLSYYDTTEPLAYYSRSRRTPQNILILENKDTFYSMRRYLMEGNAQILGLEIDTLIYGAGKGILRSFQDFAFSAEPYMQEPGNQIYYFGDLDYEGIGIYERLAESFADRCRIYPFAAAYERMLEKAARYDQLPETKERQNRNLSGLFYTYFTPGTVRRMRVLLEMNRYIPQEILNINDLRKSDKHAILGDN